MPKSNMNYRVSPLEIGEGGKPTTLDEATRSVEIVATTEKPAEVFDWSRLDIINEVLLMSGVEMPKSRQVPLLDSHSRYSTASVLGSLRNMEVSGQKLIGRAYFSSVEEAEAPYTKVKEGHLTDFSVGYRVIEAEWVPAGKTATVKGNSYSGPLSIVTRWRVKEVSTVTIGADEDAKARSEMENQNMEAKKMNKELREYLESKGLPKEATEEEAKAFADKLSAKEDPAPVDVDKIRAEAVGEERERISEIDAMCKRFECEDLADDLVRSGATVDQAKDKVFPIVQKRIKDRQANLKPFPPARIEADERDKFREAAQDALYLRAGIVVAKPAMGADELRGYSLSEIARIALKKAGKESGGNAMEMVGRALVTSDFPYLLANTANKALFAGWEAAEETWSIWCGIGSVPDFKTNYRPRVSEISDLDEVPESGEYKYGERSEAQESFAIATYGKLYAITRQAIINDDLGALTDNARAHGEAASRKIGDVAYAVLTANAAMGDGVALFHATHANLGTAGVISSATIAEAIKLMKVQKDLLGKRRLNIRPLFLLAPVALEGSHEIFFRTQLIGGVANQPNLVNPYMDPYFTRVYEPRLDDASATAWYLAARRDRTVVVFFLNGIQAPYLETKQGWSVDGVEYKVRIDVGAKALDWKGLVKNLGA